jgi:hypothetical protein
VIEVEVFSQNGGWEIDPRVNLFTECRRDVDTFFLVAQDLGHPLRSPYLIVESSLDSLRLAATR